jgi:hypothetical protein
MVVARPYSNFSRTDVRPLIKFHVLFDTSAVERYKSWQEGLGAYSYKIVRQWVNAIKNGREERHDDSRSVHQQWQLMNAPWNK